MSTLTHPQGPSLWAPGASGSAPGSNGVWPRARRRGQVHGYAAAWTISLATSIAGASAIASEQQSATHNLISDTYMDALRRDVLAAVRNLRIAVSSNSSPSVITAREAIEALGAKQIGQRESFDMFVVGAGDGYAVLSERKQATITTGGSHSLGINAIGVLLRDVDIDGQLFDQLQTGAHVRVEAQVSHAGVPHYAPVRTWVPTDFNVLVDFISITSIEGSPVVSEPSAIAVLPQLASLPALSPTHIVCSSEFRYQGRVVQGLDSRSDNIKTVGRRIASGIGAFETGVMQKGLISHHREWPLWEGGPPADPGFEIEGLFEPRGTKVVQLMLSARDLRRRVLGAGGAFVPPLLVSDSGVLYPPRGYVCARSKAPAQASQSAGPRTGRRLGGAPPASVSGAAGATSTQVIVHELQLTRTLAWNRAVQIPALDEMVWNSGAQSLADLMDSFEVSAVYLIPSGKRIVGVVIGGTPSFQCNVACQ